MSVGESTCHLLAKNSRIKRTNQCIRHLVGRNVFDTSSDLP